MSSCSCSMQERKNFTGIAILTVLLSIYLPSKTHIIFKAIAGFYRPCFVLLESCANHVHKIVAPFIVMEKSSGFFGTKVSVGIESHT